MKGNFFDNLDSFSSHEDVIKQNKILEEQANKLDYLIHKVFQQGQDGKDLLAIWGDTLMMSSGADAGMDLIDIGIKEGYKRFIRNIILTIKKVEGS